MTDRVEAFDLASEIDFQRMERIMSRCPDHTCEVIYSPYILLMWKDQYGTVRLAYFERQSQKDMKLAEEILNSYTILHQDLNIKFPFAFMKWKE